MPEWVWLVLLLIGYVILTQWLFRSYAFPREGAPVAPSLGVRRQIATKLRRRRVK
jgi:hypothetical protein